MRGVGTTSLGWEKCVKEFMEQQRQAWLEKQGGKK